MMQRKLIKLHRFDNVLIALADIDQGEWITVEDKVIQVNESIGIGNKIAERSIQKGQKIVKYGVPIGSATEAINMGALVHLHNMKSDYIPTYTIEKEYREGIKENENAV